MINKNKKQKMLAVYKTVKNMRPGDRFLLGGHSSMMIMTDLRTQTFQKKQRLAVSENGLSEWMDEYSPGPSPTYLMVVDAKKETIRATGVLKKKILDKITHNA